MRVVSVRNVTAAWKQLPRTLHDAELLESRNGPVLVCPEPVATVYTHPTERVLLDPERDAHPFFHLVEALWMLDGRSSASDLTPYVRDFGKYAEEEDGGIHGAYGARWRYLRGSLDQLDAIVEKLASDPNDRQCVLQMWDASFNDDLEGNWRDRPCNTHAYFRLRGTSYHAEAPSLREYALDMTVCCRSNDMIFGGYGANAVHFSVLQEYMAAKLGVSVGTYTQISNNFHVYVSVWDRKKPSSWGQISVACSPMFSEPDKIDGDVTQFMRWHDIVLSHKRDPTPDLGPPRFNNLWFAETAEPMVLAHSAYRGGDVRLAIDQAQLIRCPAWRRAAVEWLQRRQK